MESGKGNTTECFFSIYSSKTNVGRRTRVKEKACFAN